MTSRFTKFLPFILRWECVRNRAGQVMAEHDPDDPGGLTKYGIDQRSHPRVDVATLTLAGATAIYWAEWQREMCDDLPTGLGEVYFNAAVNCGIGRANSLMSIAQGRGAAFLDAQDSFYGRLAAAKPASAKFLRGWLNRTADLRKFLALV